MIKRDLKETADKYKAKRKELLFFMTICPVQSLTQVNQRWHVQVIIEW